MDNLSKIFAVPSRHMASPSVVFAYNPSKPLRYYGVCDLVAARVVFGVSGLAIGTSLDLIGRQPAQGCVMLGIAGLAMLFGSVARVNSADLLSRREGDFSPPDRFIQETPLIGRFLYRGLSRGIARAEQDFEAGPAQIVPRRP